MDEKLKQMIASYPNNELVLDEIENRLIKIITSGENDIEHLIQYVLVLLHEPILDYDKAYACLAKQKDIKAFLLRCYIEEWYYGRTPEVNIQHVMQYHDKYDKSALYSCLLHYASLNAKDKAEKLKLLKQSLQAYQYNFMSVIEISKTLGEGSGDVEYNEINSYLERCIRFNNKLKRTSFFKNLLLFKPFMFQYMLGFNRDTENIMLLMQTQFKSNPYSQQLIHELQSKGDLF